MANENLPLISAVVLNWNGKKWNKKILDSLSKQSYKNLEIIFVDNHSTDNSLEIVQKNFSKIKIIKNDQNLGFAGGNNSGIAKANGKLIMLINNDTWVANDFIERLYLFYAANSYAVVAPYEADYEGIPKKEYITTIDLFGHPVYKYGQFDASKNLYLSGCCLLFSKQTYTETAGLDDNFFMYCEEVDWFWRLKLMGKTISYTPGIYINHAGAGSTGRGIQYNVFLWRNENTLQMLIKNYKSVNLLWVLPIYFIQAFAELGAFFILGKGKIASSYINAIIFNAHNLRRTLKMRKNVQNMREKGDLVAIRSMYKGFGKLRHLKHVIVKQKVTNETSI